MKDPEYHAMCERMHTLVTEITRLEAELRRLREHPELTDAQCDRIMESLGLIPNARRRAAIRKALEDSNG